MKKFLLFLMLVTGSSAYANDFDTSQHNFRLRVNDFGIEVREEANSSKDHVQLSYYGVKDLAIDYRYVDNSSNIENRIRATYNLYDNGTFFIKPRVEYRIFETTNDYWRIRSTIGIRALVTDKILTWADTQLSWNFGDGQSNNTKIDSNQARIGVDYLVDNKMSLGTFVQYETDENWNKTGVFLGTNFLIKF